MMTDTDDDKKKAVAVPAATQTKQAGQTKQTGQTTSGTTTEAGQQAAGGVADSSAQNAGGNDDLPPAQTYRYTHKPLTDDKSEEMRERGMAEMLELLKKGRANYAPETEDERKKRVKRERANAIIAALGDGISAISNMVTSSKGAPSMYEAQNGMLPKWRERYDKAKAARKEREDNYLNYTAKMQELANQNSEWKRKIAIDEANQDRLDAELARKQALAAAQAGRIDAMNRKDDAAFAYYNTKAECLTRMLPYKVAESEAIAARNRALEKKANRSGNGTSGKKGGGSKSSAGKDYTETTTRDYVDQCGTPRHTTTTKVRTYAGNKSKSGSKSGKKSKGKNNGGWAAGLKL